MIFRLKSGHGDKEIYSLSFGITRGSAIIWELYLKSATQRGFHYLVRPTISSTEFEVLTFRDIVCKLQLMACSIMVFTLVGTMVVERYQLWAPGCLSGSSWFESSLGLFSHNWYEGHEFPWKTLNGSTGAEAFHISV